MKKFLFIAVVAIAAFSATPTPVEAQIPTKKILTKDTATNAEEVYLPYTFKGTAAYVTNQVVLTKVSGTTAGFVVIQASLDGTNYTTISTDTLTLANQTTNYKLFTPMTGAKYDYYRMWVHATGTQVTGIQGYVLFR